jgi:hypothetical protein
VSCIDYRGFSLSYRLLFTRTLIQFQDMLNDDSDQPVLANAKSVVGGFKQLIKKEFDNLKFKTVEIKDMKLPLFFKSEEDVDEKDEKDGPSDISPDAPPCMISISLWFLTFPC